MNSAKMIPLSDICFINMGQSPSSSSYNNNGKGIPFFQGNADFGEIYPQVRYWCNQPIKKAKKNDILISVRAPIGAINIATEECCIGRGLASLKIDEKFGTYKYLFYALKNKVNDLISSGKGSTFKAVNKKDLEDIYIIVPSKKEQIHIVNALDMINKLIFFRKNQINSLNLLVKSRFIEMFGDPVSNPMNWKKITLSEACLKITDGTHFSPPSSIEGGFMYITAKNIKLNRFDFSNLTYVSDSEHREIYNRCNPEYGDILYIKDGATTGIALINTLKEEFSLLSSVALLKPNYKTLSNYYLCDVLNNQNMYTSIRSTMGGAAITRLTVVKIKNILIPIPPISLQNQYAKFVQQVDKSKFVILKNLTIFNNKLTIKLVNSAGQIAEDGLNDKF